MRRQWILALVLMALVASVTLAENWQITTPVGDGQVDVWFQHGAGRTKIGPAFSWIDNDGSPDDGDAFGLGFVAGYDLVQDANFVIGDITIPATLTVGAKGQVMLYSQSGDVDPAPSLFTSLMFGTENMSLGPVYQYALTNDLWDHFAPQSEHLLMIAGCVRF